MLRKRLIGVRRLNCLSDNGHGLVQFIRLRQRPEIALAVAIHFPENGNSRAAFLDRVKLQTE